MYRSTSSATSPTPAATRTSPSESTGSSPRPRSFQRTSTSRLGTTAAPKTIPSRHRRATRYASAAPAPNRRFGGFVAPAAPEEQARHRRVGDPARVERANDEERRGENDDHRREVGERRQPERLREEVLGPALLVAVDEQRNGRERRDDPEKRRPVPEQPPADPLRDPVDAEERDRREHEQVERDDRRQRLDEGRPREPHEWGEDERPEVAELGGGQLEVPEHPALGRDPDLVAVVEPHPPVVRDRRGKQDRRSRAASPPAPRGRRGDAGEVRPACGSRRGRRQPKC